MSRELGDVQRQQKDLSQTVSERLSKFEPVKVSVDGVEFQADPAEKRDFESALSVFRKGDFASAQSLFVAFIGRYAGSQYCLLYTSTRCSSRPMKRWLVLAAS